MLAQSLTSSNLPIVIINTDNGGGIPFEPKVRATMKIIWHPDGSRNFISDQDKPEFLNYNGKIGIEFLKASPDLEYCVWPYDGGTIDDEHLFLLDIFRSLNKKVYVRNYNYLGIDSTQIIIPGVSEISGAELRALVIWQ